jgi:hypothetical protein
MTDLETLPACDLCCRLFRDIKPKNGKPKHRATFCPFNGFPLAKGSVCCNPCFLRGRTASRQWIKERAQNKPPIQWSRSTINSSSSQRVSPKPALFLGHGVFPVKTERAGFTHVLARPLRGAVIDVGMLFSGEVRDRLCKKWPPAFKTHFFSAEREGKIRDSRVECGELLPMLWNLVQQEYKGLTPDALIKLLSAGDFPSFMYKLPRRFRWVPSAQLVNSSIKPNLYRFTETKPGVLSKLLLDRYSSAEDRLELINGGLCSKLTLLPGQKTSWNYGVDSIKPAVQAVPTLPQGAISQPPTRELRRKRKRSNMSTNKN